MIDMRTKFVAVSIYTVAPERLSAVADAARSTMERDVHRLAGFREGIAMADEDQTQVLIVTQWDSKDAWVRAEWEPTIGKAVANLVEDAKAYNVRTFVPITIVRPEAASS
jgi:heme-degrading monooxygenase HmoA